MKVLWDHIDFCQKTFEKFLQTKWVSTKPGDMEDDVKKLMKTLREMKVDKRCGAFTGIQDEIKKWLTILPLFTELADDAMRERHWDLLKKKINV